MYKNPSSAAPHRYSASYSENYTSSMVSKVIPFNLIDYNFNVYYILV
jgi:hypothetical protein